MVIRRQSMRLALWPLVSFLLMVLFFLTLGRYLGLFTRLRMTTNSNNEYPTGVFIQNVKKSLGEGAFKTFLEDCMKSADYQTGERFIVYDCSYSWEGDCGGWSDRIAGILTTFIISILAKRRFLVNFDKPCYLEDYFAPSYFSWRYEVSTVWNKSSSFHKLRNNNYKQIEKYLFGREDINTYFTEDVVYLRMNWDFLRDFKSRPGIGKDVPWITKYHQADIYKHFIDVFFKLPPTSEIAISERIRANRKRSKLACVHIRHGTNPNMPRDNKRPDQPLDVLWGHFDKLNKDEYDLFVASDTDSVKGIAKVRYPGNIIDTPGNITHIDQPHKNDERQGFVKQLLDFYTLVSCDILIIPSSGFSMLAAFVRSTDTGLYCWRGQDIIPCSRYTIGDIFPIGKYGIKPKTYRN
ncbi:uncharacterized protein [Argopecten irradians]|uniref:uncharacterized protein n=1 Tax=Argopecten irradians TaxID=31199 RepID=UPI0037233291